MAEKWRLIMQCPKCDTELYIDHEDSQGLFWYTCLNPRCPDFRRAFNPISGVVKEAVITSTKKPNVVMEDDANNAE